MQLEQTSRNVVYHSVGLMLHVSMLFLLAIPKSLSFLKEFLYTLVNTIVPCAHIEL